jgi:tRNA (cytidine/uridine-2'-O-)-methyltransferase
MAETPLLHVALWEPEIPPNTGNIARLCAATATRLHLIGRLGFRIDDRTMKRAGLDYWEAVDWRRHDAFADLEGEIPADRIICIETGSDRIYTQAPVCPGLCLLFGNESHGLPPTIRERYADRIYGIPMPGGQVRSLNLANAVGIVLYDALRRLHSW